MLTPINWKSLTEDEQCLLLQRPLKKNENAFVDKVKEIISRVREQKDEACKLLTKQFDGVELDFLEVTQAEFAMARQKIKAGTRSAIERVCKQLSAFHLPQKLKTFSVETSPGIRCESIAKPIERVGLYIPGGTAPLISTVLMLGVPAQIANCQIRIMCTPPNKEGDIDPSILFAAEFCGIQKIYKLGGAQAIAAMAYGTETIPKVDKIFGPGNSFVTQAKILVSNDAAGAVYDLPAGPSEVMVIADANANPHFIAADLLSQAEHGSDSQVLLVCTDVNVASQVNAALAKQLSQLSRQSIAVQALQHSRLIMVDDVRTAIAIANDYAPEHLILQTCEPRQYLDDIKNAGSVFLGPWSPESAGDYASGTNHVLPTFGYARNLSGLSVRDFMKTITVQELTREGLVDIAETIRALTTIEGLDGHQRAVDIRVGGELT